MPRRSAERAPLAVALAMAAWMVALARGPFDASASRGSEALVLLPLALHAPSGTFAQFPRSFEWSETPGAEVYEVTVASEPDGRALFRQRGTSPHLELSFDPGAEPPPGSYVWEVLAYRGGVPCARGGGRFVVRPTPAPSVPAPPGGPATGRP